MYNLISEIFPPDVGGSGRWFYEVFKRFSEQDYMIISKALRSGLEEQPDIPSSRVSRIPFDLDETGAFSWKGFETYRRIKTDVRKQLTSRTFGKDEVFVAARMVPEGWIAASIVNRRNSPLVCFAHGEEINKSQRQAGGFMSSLQHRWMGAFVARRVDHWITNSQNTSDILTSQWKVPSIKISVIHPGVDIDAYYPVAPDQEFRRMMGWQDRYVLLTVGRLQKRKGHDHLIGALPQLLRIIPNLLYVIVGDGQEKRLLQNQVQSSGLEENVSFIFEASDSMVRKCYQQADLFILPNRSVGADIEGFGMVLVEAGACGIPVCAGRSGGTSETMIEGETGFLLDCSTPDSLAAELSKVLSNNELRLVGERAAKFCREKFSWMKVSSEVRRVLEQVRVGNRS